MVYQILLPMVLRWRASRAGAPLLLLTGSLTFTLASIMILQLRVRHNHWIIKHLAGRIFTAIASIRNESGAPNDCCLWNICSEKQKLPRIFYSLRKAENFYMTVPFMYNFRSLSNKIPMRLSQDGFLVISFIFSIRFCLFSFVFAA